MKMQEEQKIMEFPMEFPIKVMGVNDEALLAEMNALAGTFGSSTRPVPRRTFPGPANTCP